MIKSKGAINVWTKAYRWTTTRETDGVLTENLTWRGSGTTGRLETINFDDTKHRGPIKRTRFCHHVVREEQDKEVVFEGYFENPLHFRHPCPVGFPPFSEPSIPDVSNFHAEALNFFNAGCTDNEMSLLTSLIEIGDIKHLGPQLLKSLTTLMQSSVNYTFRSLKRDLKAGADIHLSYNFGIKPIISDVKNLYRSLDSLSERIHYLRENSGKPLRVQFTRTLPSSDTRVIRVNDTYFQVIDESKTSGNYVAFALVTYDVSKLSDLELRLRILKKSLGLSDLASTAWELIPFSFLVDWIVDIGNWISSIPDMITIPMIINDCGWYVKLERQERTTLVAKKPAGNSRFPGNWRVTRMFHREPGLPRSFASIVADGDLSLQQLGLSLSLALQRWR